MQDFRLFYNQHIFPELSHLEQRRRRLIGLLATSVVLFVTVAATAFIIDIFLVTLLLMIPVGLWIAYIVFQIQLFFQEFKPRIVGLILDFIDNDVNYSFGSYSPKRFIPKKLFLESKIFTVADDYTGEDYIEGMVRETPFQLSELRVKEFSQVRSRLDYVFRGIFLIGDFQRADMHGGVLILPDAYRKYMVRTEKAFHLIGGRRVKDNLLPEFETFFDTYATTDVRIKDVISKDLQRAILLFRMQFQQMNREKDIYCSIIGDKIYLALTQDKDLLEPSLLSTNVQFETVREIYEDIRMLLEVVKEVDVMN